MKCKICTNDPYELVILPIKQPDGKLNIIACLGCSYESEHFCRIHEKPNMGFMDNSSACLTCIQETVLEDGVRIAADLAVKAQEAPNHLGIKSAVEEYLEDVSTGLMAADLGELPLVILVTQTNNAQNIARPIVTYVLRKKIKIEEAIERTLQRPEVVFLGVSEQEV